MNTSLGKPNSRLAISEEKLSEVEDTAIETLQTKAQKLKKKVGRRQAQAI
jgi:hypothetical protein